MHTWIDNIYITRMVITHTPHKFRKPTKNWDTTPTLKNKKYKHISGLMDDIVSQQSNIFSRLKDIVLEESHPNHRQATIGNVEPPPTGPVLIN